MEKKYISLPRRQLLQAAAIAGGLPLLQSAYSAMPVAAASSETPEFTPYPVRNDIKPAGTGSTKTTVGSGPVRIAVLDDPMRLVAKLADWAPVNGRATVDIYHDHIYNQDALARRLAPYDIIVMERYRTPLKAEVIAKLPKLKFVVATGADFSEFLDLPQCKKQNIAVSSAGGGVPGGGSVEEVAWTLVMDLARQVTWHNNDMHAGKWQIRPSNGLAGKTVGCVGLGNQGLKMVQFAKAFRMKTVAWSMNMTDKQAADGGSTRVEFKDLLAQSDFVIINYRYGERSHHLFKAEHFAQMKPTAYLVNTSRGPVVDEDAMIAALKSKRIAGAGLDVFDVEPLPVNHPFVGMDNVIMTPHIGYPTVESVQGMYSRAVESLVAYLDGKPIRLLDLDKKYGET